jgi:hypothetical protein
MVTGVRATYELAGWLPSGLSSVRIERCTGCGSLVIDRGQHDQFHRALTALTLESAALEEAHLDAAHHARWDVADQIMSRFKRAMTADREDAR